MSFIEQTTGLILAGGAGRRVGGQDKGTLEWRGKTLAEHVAQRLRPQVARLLISCNRNTDYYATLADTVPADRRREFQGPLAGIEMAVGHLAGEILIVAPCDTPLLPPDLALRLITALGSANGGPDVSYVYDGENNHYLCAALRARILPSVTPFLDAGHRAVRHWYAQQHCVVVDFADQAKAFANYNRPL